VDGYNHLCVGLRCSARITSVTLCKGRCRRPVIDLPRRSGVTRLNADQARHYPRGEDEFHHPGVFGTNPHLLVQAAGRHT
jgi:hypothetical protein